VRHDVFADSCVAGSGPPIIAFRDASFGLCTYQLTVLDAVRGLHKAAAVGAFSFDSYVVCPVLLRLTKRITAMPFPRCLPAYRFDIDAYERLEQFKNGDMNWLIPGKFLAFSGPLDDPKPLPGGGYTFRPHDYVPIFKAIGVTMVVRLNKGHYDRTTFVENGIKHVDLYYPDGSVPSDEILQEFLRVTPSHCGWPPSLLCQVCFTLTCCRMQIAEREPGGIAVHCKAGLGRTGTCIGAYVMKHFGFTAKECIGWFRICRPGSVLGPQQYYMEVRGGVSPLLVNGVYVCLL
jgi:cell division cycle 14